MIDEKIKSGYKQIVICAPTGSGKSPIAATLAKAFKSSFIVTASKSLQDQYQNDFSFLKPIKGKQNFGCLKLMEKEKFEKDDFSLAIKTGLTCDRGECIEKTSVNGKKFSKNCKFKPGIQEFQDGKFENKICPYYDQKYLALTSPHSLWNYHVYFQLMKFNQSAYGQYLGRKVSIFDEAHKIENQILQFIGIDIASYQLDECGLEVKNYDLKDIESIISLVDDMAQFYAREIEQIKNSRSFQNNPDFRRIEPLEKKYDRAAQVRSDVIEDKENFVINEPSYEDSIFNSISIIPLDISKYVKEFFLTEYQIFMSATIEKNSFCETTGLPTSEVGFVDVPHSPFKLESRKINFLNIKRLSYQSPKEDELTVIKKIDDLLLQHLSERGIILTSSILRCEKILQNLSPENQKRVRICHAKNKNDKTQNEILKEHQDTKNSVLLSSSLWEGVDLKDDLARFQIIAKVPFPNYKEKRTALKKEKYPLWYTSQTLMKLLQGFGRSTRNEKDWSITYVLDSSVNYLLHKSKNMIPQAFHDELGFTN